MFKVTRFVLLFALSSAFSLDVSYAQSQAAQCSDLLNNSFKKLHSSKTIDFCKRFKGKVILAVNTASQCGFTPQFKSLESLYKKYKDQGLVVVGFPSADFDQEFKDEEKTASMCYKNYGVTFPMVATSSVKGDSANPFFKALAKKSGTQPKWNFYKYLVSRDGKQILSYSSMTKPDDSDLIEKIEQMLKQKS